VEALGKAPANRLSAARNNLTGSPPYLWFDRVARLGLIDINIENNRRAKKCSSIGISDAYGKHMVTVFGQGLLSDFCQWTD